MARKQKNRFKKAPDLKASTVRRLIRTGMTIVQICAQYGISRVTLYKRFGDEIKGRSPRGRRPKGNK